jgi:O-methyltransferase involved in polyketide biosynthesis
VQADDRRAQMRERFERIAAQFGVESTLDVQELIYSDPDRADVAVWLAERGWASTATSSRDEMRRLGRSVELQQTDGDAFSAFVTAVKS